MKRILIVVMCVVMLLLSGCSGGKYSLSDVENALSGFPDVTLEHWPEESLELIDADGSTDAIYAQANNNPDFCNINIFIFKSSAKAKAFFNRYKGENFRVYESGNNYCYVKDTGVYDIVVKYYLYIRDNVVFMKSVSGGEKGDKDLDFCRNTLPDIADALD